MRRSPGSAHGRDAARPLSQDAALELAARALGRRGLSERAVRERLRDAGAAPAVEDETIATLVRLGYLDDDRLASERADRLAARGYGNAAVDARLASDGIDPAARQAALAALEPEDVRARRVVAGRATAEPVAARGVPRPARVRARRDRGRALRRRRSGRAGRRSGYHESTNP